MHTSVSRTLILFGVLFLSGCAQMSTQTTTPSAATFHAPQTLLTHHVSEQLSQQSGYLLIRADDTQWGNNIEFDVSPVYFAASGRVCREMLITQEGSSRHEQVIACQYGHDWGVTRNVTQALKLDSATR